MTNSLINETSPYLLQHAHNPVDWYAWSEEAWSKARTENKLVLVSIGYSSCHWCHVMEHETFEDVEAARLMNEHFVCIKVDREERPDVDQVYMTAVQLMTGSGGWPLNCFCLPDGRPLYGGTYFPNAAWKEVLVRLHDFYTNNKSQAEQYAKELSEGVSQTESVVQRTDQPAFSKDNLKEMVEGWKSHFDFTEGGPNRAPKFPMPNNYEFLLRYAVVHKDEGLKNYVLLTLDKMAFGGIYDQVGGGFCRYSTDTLWKVPHFEKMLYDNAQLVSLYSQAYQLTKKELYKEVAYETLEFIEREMTSPDEGFYSALDADSEGVEGKYYVWTKEELNASDLIAEYFNINQEGYWEHGNYILLRKKTDEQIAEQFSISVEKLKQLISEFKKTLLEKRSLRIRPGLDNKILTSWNSLMIKGCCDAYDAFGEKKFLDTAIRAAELLRKKSLKEDGSLTHQITTKAVDQQGFLEDYSFFAEALIALYQCTFNEEYLQQARKITDYALLHFYDAEAGMFWFTSNLAAALFVRKKEIHDNVIPSSNSSMAKVLFHLGKYFDDKKYLEISSAMLHNVQPQIKRYASSFSNWAMLMLCHIESFYEIVFVGKDAMSLRNELTAHYLPNNILAGSVDGVSELTLLKNRYSDNKSSIYICRDYACKMPVGKVSDALQLLEYSF